MSLEVMTILCRCENIETSEGVPLDVTGVAQVMHFKRPKKKNNKKTKNQAVAGAGDQGKTEENGSTNKLTLSVFVCFSHLHAFFSSAVEGRQSAVTNLGFAVKLNSESPLATGSINEGYRSG